MDQNGARPTRCSVRALCKSLTSNPRALILDLITISKPVNGSTTTFKHRSSSWRYLCALVVPSCSSSLTIMFRLWRRCWMIARAIKGRE
ncbi:hypothetical protein M408DRAFT_138615 [Serendipita vermifera MAFF 305830]|uniref:Uncharacterized protein n=1 Tax=Serendipita vermifera MAFF 305830 TaxID=933852 RepID=A0A0C2W1J1_SERVB|nr:hypothetical protein M408DRAFT_138615 [Serendipita vermifera MAFF 305830]